MKKHRQFRCSRKVLDHYIQEAEAQGMTVYEDEEFFEILESVGLKNLQVLWGVYAPKSIPWPNAELPARTIVLRQSLPNYLKLHTLFHEMGHDHCNMRDCACMHTKSRYRTELHAMQFCIQKIKDEKLIEALRLERAMHRQRANSKQKADYYTKASQRILEDERFRLRD